MRGCKHLLPGSITCKNSIRNWWHVWWASTPLALTDPSRSPSGDDNSGTPVPERNACADLQLGLWDWEPKLLLWSTQVYELYPSTNLMRAVALETGAHLDWQEVDPLIGGIQDQTDTHDDSMKVRTGANSKRASKRSWLNWNAKVEYVRVTFRTSWEWEKSGSEPGYTAKTRVANHQLLMPCWRLPPLVPLGSICSAQLLGLRTPPRGAKSAPDMQRVSSFHEHI